MRKLLFYMFCLMLSSLCLSEPTLEKSKKSKRLTKKEAIGLIPDFVAKIRKEKALMDQKLREGEITLEESEKMGIHAGTNNMLLLSQGGHILPKVMNDIKDNLSIFDFEYDPKMQQFKAGNEIKNLNESFGAEVAKAFPNTNIKEMISAALKTEATLAQALLRKKIEPIYVGAIHVNDWFEIKSEEIVNKIFLGQEIVDNKKDRRHTTLYNPTGITATQRIYDYLVNLRKLLDRLPDNFLYLLKLDKLIKSKVSKSFSKNEGKSLKNTLDKYIEAYEMNMVDNLTGLTSKMMTMKQGILSRCNQSKRNLNLLDKNLVDSIRERKIIRDEQLSQDREEKCEFMEYMTNELSINELNMDECTNSTIIFTSLVELIDDKLQVKADEYKKQIEDYISNNKDLLNSKNINFEIRFIKKLNKKAKLVNTLTDNNRGKLERTYKYRISTGN